MVSAGYLEQVHSALDQLGDFHTGVHIKAGSREIITGNTAFNREAGAYRLSDLIKGHYQESCAVFQASAKFVRSLILHRGKELGEKPAMGCVNLHHVESAVLAEFRRGPVGLHDFQDHLLRHLLHMSDRSIFIADAPGFRLGAVGSSDAGKAAPFSAVGQLNIGVGSGVMNSAGRIAKPVPHAEGIQLELLVMGFSGCRMHDRFPIGHDGAASLRLLFQIGDHILRKMSLCRHHAGAGRSRNDAVLQADIPNSDRFK